MPPPPAWWPPAYGWWLLAGTVMIVGTIVLVIWLRRRRRARWRRRLLAALDDLAEAYRQRGDAAWLASELSQWLRRAAGKRDPRTWAMHGEAWKRQVEAWAPADMDVAVLHDLQTAMYQASPAFDAGQALKATRHWLLHVLAGKAS